MDYCAQIRREPSIALALARKCKYLFYCCPLNNFFHLQFKNRTVFVSQGQLSQHLISIYQFLHQYHLEKGLRPYQCDKKKHMYIWEALVNCTGFPASKKKNLATADVQLENCRRREKNWFGFSVLNSAAAAGMSNVKEMGWYHR